MQNPVEPDDFLSMHPEMVLSPEDKKRWAETRTGAIVGKSTADRFHWKVGDKVPIFSPIWRKADGSQTWEFDIVGIFTANQKVADTMSMFFRYDYFDEARLGGAIGLALACTIVPVVGKALANTLPLFFFPSRDLLLGVGICIALGILTGIFPALAAMRLRVADALRRM